MPTNPKFVRLKNGYFFKGQSFFSLGVNYMPANYSTKMWENWGPEEMKEVEKDLLYLKSIGIDSVRIPLFWHYFMEEKGKLNKKAIKKFNEFLEVAEKVGVYVAPTLLVGQMSGTIYGPKWVQKKNEINMDKKLDVDLYTQPMLGLQAKYMGMIAKRYKDYSIINMWILSNEQEWYQKPPTPKHGKEWTERMVEEIRKYDKNHLIVHGLDSVCILDEVNFHQRDYCNILDALTVHFYPIYHQLTLIDDAFSAGTRHKYLGAFTISITKKRIPVHLEEFGTSLSNTSEYYQAVLYRQTFITALMYGACSAWVWCAKDFTPLKNRLPYKKEPHEVCFGIIKVDNFGKSIPRKVVVEIKRAKKILRKLGNFSQYNLPKADGAIIIPKFYYKNIDALAQSLYSAFILARMAHINVTFIDEDDVDGIEEYKLIFIPSPSLRNIGELSTTFWDKIEAYVKSGGTLYLSYGNPAILNFELFGVDIEYEVLRKECEIIFPTGEKMSYSPISYDIRLKTGVVTPTTGKVIGHDQFGKPAVIINQYGAGKTMLVTYPVEFYISNEGNVFSRDKTYKLYELCAEMANLRRKYTARDQFIDIGYFESKKHDIVFLRNITSNEKYFDLEVNNTEMQAINLETRKELPLQGKCIKIRIPPDDILVIKVMMDGR